MADQERASRNGIMSTDARPAAAMRNMCLVAMLRSSIMRVTDRKEDVDLGTQKYIEFASERSLPYL